jgi:hypothetical protein
VAEHPAIATAAAARVAMRARAATHATSSTSAGPPPACHVESKTTLAIGKDDRATILPDGTIVVAREIRKQIRFQRITESGSVPYPTGVDRGWLDVELDEVALGGVRFSGKPAVFSEVLQGPRGTLLAMWLEGGGYSMTRLRGLVTGLATASFGPDVVAFATMHVNENPNEPPPAAEMHLITARASRRALIETGVAEHPAIATTAEHIAVVYSLGPEMHFALLDKEMQRLGDIIPVTSKELGGAVAFVGESVALFWVERGPKTRLMASTYTPGANAVSAAKIAIDEPALPLVPVAAALPNGTSTVAWVASAGGRATVRISPIGPGGTLTGPTDVDVGSAISDLLATPGDHGVHLTWLDGGSTMKLARVACP